MSPLTMGLVVVAAGSGKRFGGPKQFALLAGKPLLEHCLVHFDTIPEIIDRVVVLSPELEDTPEWQKILTRLRYPVHVVPGGAERADSVRCGVEALNSACDLAIVHDGARPFPPLAAMTECVKRLENQGDLAGAIVASPMNDTLKSLDEDGLVITRTLDRSNIVRAETPQVCRRALLLEALAHNGASMCTDEAQVLESAQMRTAAIVHTGFNIKITRPEDLRIAKTWLRRRTDEETQS